MGLSDDDVDVATIDRDIKAVFDSLTNDYYDNEEFFVQLASYGILSSLSSSSSPPINEEVRKISSSCNNNNNNNNNKIRHHERNHNILCEQDRVHAINFVKKSTETKFQQVIQ